MHTSSQTVSVDHLAVGHIMYIYSSRRREPRRVKIKAIFKFSNYVMLHTTGGIHRLPANGVVDVPVDV